MYKNDINLNLYKDFYAAIKYGSLAKASKYTYTSAPGRKVGSSCGEFRIPVKNGKKNMR